MKSIPILYYLGLPDGKKEGTRQASKREEK